MRVKQSGVHWKGSISIREARLIRFLLCDVGLSWRRLAEAWCVYLGEGEKPTQEMGRDIEVLARLLSDDWTEDEEVFEVPEPGECRNCWTCGNDRSDNLCKLIEQDDECGGPDDVNRWIDRWNHGARMPPEDYPIPCPGWKAKDDDGTEKETP